jgi:MinD superfamily P-loop ATPase
MGPGEENSGKLVTCIREKARQLATEKNSDYIINDGSPGIGCPVIASVTGTDVVLLVIEPSLTGIHDAERLYKLVQSFNIPAFALINKFDINTEITKQAEIFLQKNDIPLIGKIPFDAKFVESMVEGKTIFEYLPDSNLTKIFEQAWQSLNSA